MYWWMFAARANAADWVLLQGTEVPDAQEIVRPWGLLQANAEAFVSGEAVTGLSPALEPFEGERAVFNRIGGASDATWGLSVRRARLGLRGVVPGADRRVSYMISAEYGDGQLTRSDAVVLTDASVTFRAAPGAHVRLGQFKLPLGEEALESNPIAAEFINFTAATAQLLLENPVADGVYTGGASAFRDVGVQVFDAVPIGRASLSYALMVSNGGMGTLEVTNPKDITGRLAFSPVVWGDRYATHRDEVGLWVFHQQGQRSLDDGDARRVRQGVGAKLERDGWQVRGEWIRAAGALELGPNPPFPGEALRVAPDGRAWGGYTYVHYERGHAAVGLRYDALHRSTESDPDLRVFRTLTADVQLVVSPRARLFLDYELRRLGAPYGSDDARAIASTMGDRLSAQATVVF